MKMQTFGVNFGSTNTTPHVVVTLDEHLWNVHVNDQPEFVLAVPSANGQELGLCKTVSSDVVQTQLTLYSANVVVVVLLIHNVRVQHWDVVFWKS